MIRFWSMMAVLACAIVCLSSSVSAQPPFRGGKDNLKQLEDEVAELKAKLEKAETRLKLAKEMSKRGPGGFGFGGGFGKGKGKGFEKKKDMDKDEKKGKGDKGEKKGKGGKDRDKESTEERLGDIEKQLKTLIKEIESLRRSRR